MPYLRATEWPSAAAQAALPTALLTLGLTTGRFGDVALRVSSTVGRTAPGRGSATGTGHRGANAFGPDDDLPHERRWAEEA